MDVGSIHASRGARFTGFCAEHRMIRIDHDDGGTEWVRPWKWRALSVLDRLRRTVRHEWPELLLPDRLYVRRHVHSWPRRREEARRQAVQVREIFDAIDQRRNAGERADGHDSQ